MTHYLEHKPGRTAVINGKEFLFFSGYDYTGISAVPAFQELLKEGLDKFGLIFPSSRISNTQLGLYKNFENKLSEIMKTEATVCFSSGFMAGKACCSLFDKVVTAPNAHPAITKNKSSLSSFTEWQEWLVKENAEMPVNTAFAADAVNIFKAEKNNFSFINKIKPRKGIIDCSHSPGITNIDGNDFPDKNILYNYSLTKAFGLIGGAVSCSEEFAAALRKTNEYAASTNISPAMMFAFLKGFDLYEVQQKKLQDNIFYFIELIKDLPEIKFHSGLPVFILPENINEEFLFQNKIIISSFAYPDVDGKKIMRIVLNALHTKDDLEILASVLHKLKY